MQLDTAMAPQLGMDTSAGTAFDAIWEDYHIAGLGMPGLGTSYQRLQGYAAPPLNNGMTDQLSPPSFLDGLIGANGQGIGITPMLMGPGYWDHEPTAQYVEHSNLPVDQMTICPAYVVLSLQVELDERYAWNVWCSLRTASRFSIMHRNWFACNASNIVHGQARRNSVKACTLNTSMCVIGPY